MSEPDGFRVKRLQDVFIGLRQDEHQSCMIAIMRGEALTIGGHRGYLMEAKQKNGITTVRLRHTGPQTCQCPEERHYEA